MRPLRTALYTAGLACLLGGAAGTAPAHAGKTYWLDSYDKGKDRFAGPITTRKLAKNVPYVATVRGTFSFFGSRDLRGDFCGQPEKQPIYRTKKRRNGFVSGDAEWLFANLNANCRKGGAQLSLTSFQFNTRKKWNNPLPIGGQRTGPNSNHTYRYPLRGEGRKVKVRLYDKLTRDNYGRLRIRYRKARFLDCTKGRFASWYYPDEATCVSAITGKPVNPTAPIAPTPIPTPAA